MVEGTKLAQEAIFRWEMYEHLAKYIDGIKFYGHVRSFDNRYYLKGSVASEYKILSGNGFPGKLCALNHVSQLPERGVY